jgi:STE24 endopeptidase
MKRRFDIKKRKIAKEYTKANRRIMILNLVVIGSVLVIFLVSGLSRRLVEYLSGFINNPLLLVFLYLLIFSIGIELITLPIDFYDGYIIEHRFNLSNQSIPQWLKQKLKGSLLTIALGVIVIELLYIFLRNTPSTWWIWMAFVWILFTVLLTHLAPVLLIPIFYKLTPLEDERLKKRLFELAKLAKTWVKDVYKINLSKDTKKANAGLTGIGKTRCIILADNLIKDYSEEEIEVALSHELGHHHHKHLLKQIAIGVVFAFLGFYCTHLILKLITSDIANISYFPLFILSLFGFFLITSPIQNWYSKRLEYQADKFSLEVSCNPNAFINLMIALSDQNLSEIKPTKLVEFFLYDHPPAIKRIRFAHQWKQLKSLNS